MSTFRNRTTPGVYITELDAFPPSIVGVQTAVPAFIGYTQTAAINGKPCYNQPIKVGSMADFENYFGGRFEPSYNIYPQMDPSTANNYDFKVQYEASPPILNSPPEVGDYLYYYLKQTTGSQFYLYDSMRLFYANGGGNCYVVSVGPYEQGSTIQVGDLLGGLEVIREQVGPTMLVIPDALLLNGQNNSSGSPNGSHSKSVQPAPRPEYQATFKSSANYQSVVRAMLQQCSDLQDRVAILDVYGTLSVTKSTLDTVITQFHTDVGSEHLSYGMAYFPFVHTSVVQLTDFNFTNISPGSLPLLQDILSWENDRLYGGTNTWAAVNTYIQQMTNPAMSDTASVKTINQNLSNATPLLADILGVIVEKNAILPPSAAMAGVYTYVDGTSGVWNAPANIELNAVDKTTYKINDTQQGDLNVPVDGKAIDVLREFIGRGVVVWGARTLDGNSPDWRYIQVRRTIIYIEQSIKTALNQFVFAANDANTWVTVTSMVSNFLENLWAQGGLMGDKATDAFTVQCGIGSTMTGMDVLNGYMIVQITLQMIHPAEFIELTFKQQMQGVG